MIEFTLFASSFVLVFLLGLQSLNVNGGHYRAVIFTSFGIGASQIALYKLVPGAGATEIIAYLSGGPIGIIAAMRFHKHAISGKRHGRGGNINSGADRP